MLNSFGTERGIFTKRSERKEVGGRGVVVYCLLINGTLKEFKWTTKVFSYDLDSLIWLRFIVKMHTFIYLGISLESYEQQFGKIYRFEKALLVIKFTKYCYWGSVGLENIGSDWGHLTNFQFSDIFVVFVSVLPASAPELSDGISFLHFSNLRTSLRDHLATPAHFLPQFSYQWVPAIIQICLCSPSLASLALSFDNSSWEEIVQMSDLASYVTHPGQWFGKTRVSGTCRAHYCHYYTSLRSFFIYKIVYLQFWNTYQTPLLPLF